MRKMASLMPAGLHLSLPCVKMQGAGARGGRCRFESDDLRKTDFRQPGILMWINTGRPSRCERLGGRVLWGPLEVRRSHRGRRWRERTRLHPGRWRTFALQRDAEIKGRGRDDWGVSSPEDLLIWTHAFLLVLTVQRRIFLCFTG